MKHSNHSYASCSATSAAHAQRGIITTFTGVLILVMLTMMVFFAMRVGIFDQRNSANDMRQKLAFHTAESGIHQAKEFFRANSIIAASSVENLLPNGSDGWVSEVTGAKRWLKCSDAGLANLTSANARGSHPCFGEPNPARRSQLYYYSHTSSMTDPTFVPLNTNTVMPGDNENVTVQALLCLLEIDWDASPPVQGCSTNTTDDTVGNFVDGSHYIVTL